MNESTMVYLAILEDRHFDDDIKVFTSLVKAVKQITEWQVDYEDKYEWMEEELGAWEYYVHAKMDDGPKMRIEKKEVR